MKKKCKTRVMMEENYALLSIPYKNLKEKQIVLQSNDDAIMKFNVSPDVYIKPYEPGIGKIVIEFRSHNRIVGEYIEYLVDVCELECE